jgi:putative endonuclease
MSRVYCVYILANRSRNLYIGVTNDLDRRMIEHRLGLVPGFTSRYRIFRLVHFERLGDIRDAIAREKEIKAWRREKKIRLIERHNPTWADLARHLPNSNSRSLTPFPQRTRERVRDDNPKGQGRAL